MYYYMLKPGSYDTERMSVFPQRTIEFFNRFKSLYVKYKSCGITEEKFEICLKQFQPYAERLSDTSTEDALEFRFGVFLYESLRHPEYEALRADLWRRTTEGWQSDFSTGNRTRYHGFWEWYKYSLTIFPPDLCPEMEIYESLSGLLRVTYPSMRKQQEQWLNALPVDKGLKKDVFPFFIQSIPAFKIKKAFTNITPALDTRIVYGTCEKAFLESLAEVHHPIHQVKPAERKLADIWSKCDFNISVWKLRFFEAVSMCFGMRNADEINTTLKHLTDSYEKEIQRSTVHVYRHIEEALQSGFYFGKLGETTRKHMGSLRPLPNITDLKIESATEPQNTIQLPAYKPAESCKRRTPSTASQKECA